MQYIISHSGLSFKKRKVCESFYLSGIVLKVLTPTKSMGNLQNKTFTSAAYAKMLKKLVILEL